MTKRKIIWGGTREKKLYVMTCIILEFTDLIENNGIFFHDKRWINIVDKEEIYMIKCISNAVYFQIKWLHFHHRKKCNSNDKSKYIHSWISHAAHKFMLTLYFRFTYLWTKYIIPHSNAFFLSFIYIFRISGMYFLFKYFMSFTFKHLFVEFYREYVSAYEI